MAHLKRKGREQCDEAKSLLAWRENLTTEQEELAAAQVMETSNVDTAVATELRTLAGRLDQNAANQQAIARDIRGSSAVEMVLSHLYSYPNPVILPKSQILIILQN